MNRKCDTESNSKHHLRRQSEAEMYAVLSEETGLTIEELKKEEEAIKAERDAAAAADLQDATLLKMMEDDLQIGRENRRGGR